jgi:hypothetical protein
MAGDNREVAKYLTAAMVPVLDFPKDADMAAMQVAYLYCAICDALAEMETHRAVPAQMPKVKSS